MSTQSTKKCTYLRVVGIQPVPKIMLHRTYIGER